MLSYEKVHISYTFLMLAALIILYLRVNVIRNSGIMVIFTTFVLLGLGALSWTISRFNFVAHNTVMSRRDRIIWTVLPVLFPLLALIQQIAARGPVSIITSLGGAGAFIVMTLWFGWRFPETEAKAAFEKRIWYRFLIISLILVAAELLLKYTVGFLGEYILNLPLIFLSWNILMVYQFNSSPPPDVSASGRFESGEDCRGLTPREMEIIRAIVRGDSNKEIASDLDISFSTVKNHIYNIFRKTGARGRVDLVNMFK